MKLRPHQQNYTDWLDGLVKPLARREDVGAAKTERAGVILLDEDVNPIYNDLVDILAYGNENSVGINYNKFVEWTLLHNRAKYVIMWHNHPPPFSARASAADYVVCRGLGKRIEEFESIHYLDNIVIAQDTWYSFRLGWQDNWQFRFCHMPSRFWMRRR